MFYEFDYFLKLVDVQINEVKANYGRKKLGQEAKKFALAALLCRLAVGSTNDVQFHEKLKKMVNKEKKNKENNMPIISGDIGDPESK